MPKNNKGLADLWIKLGARPADLAVVATVVSRDMRDSHADAHLKTLSPKEQAAALAKRAARRAPKNAKPTR